MYMSLKTNPVGKFICIVQFDFYFVFEGWSWDPGPLMELDLPAPKLQESFLLCHGLGRWWAGKYLLILKEIYSPTETLSKVELVCSR